MKNKTKTKGNFFVSSTAGHTNNEFLVYEFDWLYQPIGLIYHQSPSGHLLSFGFSLLGTVAIIKMRHYD